MSEYYVATEATDSDEVVISSEKYHRDIDCRSLSNTFVVASVRESQVNDMEPCAVCHSYD